MGAKISDVAKYAGVSTATVSKYLNNKPVSFKNKQRVSEAIKALDYRINDIARGLRTATSMTIGLLLPGISNIFTISLIEKLEEKLLSFNYSTILCNYGNNESILQQKLYLLDRKGVDGIIFVVSGNVCENTKNVIRSMQQRSVSFVLVNGEIEGISADTVLADTVNTIYDAVEYLISFGHKNIGLFSTPINTWNTAERTLGYRRVFDDYHMPVNEEYIHLFGRDADMQVECKWLTSMKEEAIRFIQSHSEMTALVLTGYRITLAGVHAVNEMEMRLGKDISIIGFDCAHINEVLIPTLTYVRLPADSIAMHAVDLMLTNLKSQSNSLRIIRDKATLVIGQSVQKI